MYTIAYVALQRKSKFIYSETLKIMHILLTSGSSLGIQLPLDNLSPVSLNLGQQLVWIYVDAETFALWILLSSCSQVLCEIFFFLNVG